MELNSSESSMMEVEISDSPSISAAASLAIVPSEIILQVFLFLNTDLDVLHCSQVCKCWYEISTDQEVWRSLYTQRWRDDTLAQWYYDVIQWKESYIRRATTPDEIYLWGNVGEHEAEERDPLRCRYPTTPRKFECEELAGKRIRQVACGNFHLALLTADDELYMMGSGLNGELGDGLGRTYTRPMKLTYEFPARIASVTCGFWSTLVVTEKGDVYCWGYTIRPHAAALSPLKSPIRVPFPEGVKITMVSAGASHMTALTDKGLVYAWGNLSDGLSGGALNEDHGVIVSEPILVEALAKLKVVQVACSTIHTLALTESGVVYMFGRSTHEVIDRPVALKGALEGKRVVKVACGNDFSVALTDQGEVYTWGHGMNGQLGHDSVSKERQPRLVEALLPHRIVHISSAWSHTIAVTETNMCYTWGGNNFGKLGNGTHKLQSMPFPIQGLPNPLKNPDDKFIYMVATGGECSLVATCAAPAMRHWREKFENLEKQRPKRGSFIIWRRPTNQFLEDAANRPPPRCQHAACPSPDGKYLYIYGGWNGLQIVKDYHVSRFNVESMTWTVLKSERADIPAPRAGHCMNLIDNKLWIFGGIGFSRTNLSELIVFDLGTNMWWHPTVHGDLPTARESFSATTVGKKIYLFGGMDVLYYNDVYCFDTETLTWSKLDTKGSKPPPKQGPALVNIGDNQLLVIGGMDNNRYYNDVHVLDLDQCTWRLQPTRNPPSRRAFLSATYIPPPDAPGTGSGADSDKQQRHRGEVVVIGGSKSSRLNGVHILDLDTWEWRHPCALGEAMVGRSSHSACLIRYIPPTSSSSSSNNNNNSSSSSTATTTATTKGAVDDRKIFVFGGWAGNADCLFNDVYYMELPLRCHEETTLVDTLF